MKYISHTFFETLINFIFKTLLVLCSFGRCDKEYYQIYKKGIAGKSKNKGNQKSCNNSIWNYQNNVRTNNNIYQLRSLKKLPNKAPVLLIDFLLKPQAANARGIRVAASHLVGGITSETLSIFLIKVKSIRLKGRKCYLPPLPSLSRVNAKFPAHISIETGMDTNKINIGVAEWILHFSFFFFTSYMVPLSNKSHYRVRSHGRVSTLTKKFPFQRRENKINGSKRGKNSLFIKLNPNLSKASSLIYLTI